MCMKGLLAALAGVALMGLGALAPAQAEWFLDRCYTPGCDPYYYHPSPRGYYPYYNSGEWRSAREIRYRYRRHYDIPHYFRAWGYPKSTYDHYQWHQYHHGGHYRWDW